MPSYASVHLYTATQILATVAIFVVTLTKAAPAFPVLVLILVPLRLKVLGRLWGRGTLGLVDGWACREGGPRGGRRGWGKVGVAVGGGEESGDGRSEDRSTEAGVSTGEKSPAERVLNGNAV